jgi:ATP-binding cassette subfamily C (CFTR/MRP) protein 1
LKWWADANAGKSTQKTGMYLGVYSVFEVTAVVLLGLLVWYDIVPLIFSLPTKTGYLGTVSPP